MRCIALLLASFLPFAGCTVAPDSPAPEYTFVQIKTGSHTPATKEESQAVFGGHMANMQRLAREGALVMAGPYGQTKSDPALRGVFVFASADRAVVARWAESDPGFQANVFRFEFATLATQADLRAQARAELAREAAQEAAGRQPAPGDTIRPYVLLTAANWAGTAAAFKGHAAALLVGRLEDGRAVVVLDAKDQTVASALVAPLLGQLGTFTLDDWYASDLLVELPRRAVK